MYVYGQEWFVNLPHSIFHILSKKICFIYLRTQLVLPYEDGASSASAPPLLAYACIDAFRLNLDVGPETLEVGARLGNIMLTYEVSYLEACGVLYDANVKGHIGFLQSLHDSVRPMRRASICFCFV